MGPPRATAQLAKKDLEKLRKMPSPPPSAQRCLEMIYVTLHIAKVKGRILSLPAGKRLEVPMLFAPLSVSSHLF
jgi:hypothetical protein